MVPCYYWFSVSASALTPLPGMKKKGPRVFISQSGAGWRVVADKIRVLVVSMILLGYFFGSAWQYRHLRCTSISVFKTGGSYLGAVLLALFLPHWLLWPMH